MLRAGLLVLLSATPALADAVMVTRPVRAGDALAADILAFLDVEAEDAFGDPRDVVGLEARVNLYPGRAIRHRDVGAPTVVRRNTVVPLIFVRGGLTITVEGRALDRAGAGESVRIMNLSSRSTVTGTATADGAVIVH
ncbi:MAG: flagellar basal body P-ring formation chaperone FlgA [Pseudomonadota bacterium]